MKKAFVLAIVLAGLLHAAVGAQTTPPPSIQFFKNYFVTGDYVVGGVGLRGQGINGFAEGTIRIGEKRDATGAWVPDPDNRVPDDADILFAVLYWQGVSKDTLGPNSLSVGVMFDGHSLSPDGQPFAKLLTPGGTTPCWSSGGGTGSSGGVHRTYSFRQDVLRFFNYGSNGKPIVNGPHTVRVPDSGSSGNGVPIALGATLIVGYSDPTTKPDLSAIVLYDGGITIDNSNRTWGITLKGIFDPITPATPESKQVKATFVVGSAQSNKNEVLSVNGTPLTSPFTGSDGPSWDTLTVPVNIPSATAAAPDGITVNVGITTAGLSGADCLTPTAVAIRAPGNDRDKDGLLDLWESTTVPLNDPSDPDPTDGQLTLPLLSAMGASPDHKDIFVEIGAAQAGPLCYGNEKERTCWPAHTHLPTHESIRIVGDAFAKKGIQLHVDIGSAALPDDLAKTETAYIIRDRGGELINEEDYLCTRLATDPPWVCQFGRQPCTPGVDAPFCREDGYTDGYAATVGWKTGFRYIRDELINNPPPLPTPESDDPCEVPGYLVVPPYPVDSEGKPITCERRFDRNRWDMFHDAFFGHFAGLPKDVLPCLDASNKPVADVNGYCQVKPNPAFHTPKTTSGVGDKPGSRILISLGGFPDLSGLPVGTPNVVAGTLMHELGHNLNLTHGGAPGELNCNPIYCSVMNYSYQVRGLSQNDGSLLFDYSGQATGEGESVYETALSDGPITPEPQCRIGWYAPRVGSYLPTSKPAKRYCNGAEFPPLPPGTPPPPEYVRVDARTTAWPIHWNADAEPVPGTYEQDINFDGTSRMSDEITPQTFKSFNDWNAILLNQVGSGRNVGGLFRDTNDALTMGPLSLKLGRLDTGRLDTGRLDTGRLDTGRLDTGRLDTGLGDLGQGDTGRLDTGRLDTGIALGRGDDGRGFNGGGDLNVNDPGNPSGELDWDTAFDTAKTPPSEFDVCGIGTMGQDTRPCNPSDTPTPPTEPLDKFFVTFKASNIGGASDYRVYCVPGEELTPSQPWGSPLATVTASSAVDYSAILNTEFVDGQWYTCFGVAWYPDGNFQSDPSNLVSIKAVNLPAAAAGDSYKTEEDTSLTVPAPGVLGNDGDPDSTPQPALAAVLVAGPANAKVFALSPDGSFTYAPKDNYNGTDTFTYKATATYGSGQPMDTNTATVTLTVTAVNDAPVAGGSDTYSTLEDTSLTVAAPGVLGNDTDIDSAILTAVLFAGPANAKSFALNADGSFTYTPTDNYNGTDTFQYQASDGSLYSASATVTITVTAVNDAPVAANDSYTALTGGTLNVAAPGVLGNDTDVDGPALTAVLVSGPSHGALTLNGSGSFTYSPAAGYMGSDSFTYKANDGQLDSNTATVTITVKGYTFFGTQNAPPTSSTVKAKAGSSVPMKWQFRDGPGGPVVNSSGVHHTVTVVGPASFVVTDTDPGSSSFRYDTTSNTWYFNLQTKNASGVPYPTGTYSVTITPTTPGYLPSPVFTLTLTK